MLDGNELSSSTLRKFPPLKALDTLSLNKNKLSNVDHVLKGCASLPSLRYLSMMHCPCTPDCFAAGKDKDDYAKHRLYIIFKIKSLICLDFQDITEEEKSMAAAKGGFARTASPRESGGGGAQAEPSGPVAAAVDDVEVAVGRESEWAALSVDLVPGHDSSSARLAFSLSTVCICRENSAYVGLFVGLDMCLDMC